MGRTHAAPGRGPGGGARRWLAALLATVLLPACTTGPDPVDTLTALADRTHPGQLRLLSADPVPGGTGVRVVLTLTDDPDAAAVLTLGGPDREDEATLDRRLREAVRVAREQADRYRTLAGSLHRCGHTLVAVGSIGEPTHETLWVAPVDPARPVDRAPALLHPCRGDWPLTGPDPAPRVNLVDPAAVAALPAPDPGLPAALRATDPHLDEALRETFHYALVLRPAGSGAEPGWLRPEWPPQRWSDIAQELRTWTEGWLARSPEAGAVLGLEVHQQRRLLPGEPHRMRYYQTVCTARQTSWRCVGPMVGLVAVTVDLDGPTVGAPRLITSVRQWREIPTGRPLEPDLGR